MEALFDPDPEVRYRAVLALDGSTGLSKLLARLSDESWRVRKAAVERIAAMPDPLGAVEPLLDRLACADDAGARNAAAEALSRIGDGAVGPLVSRLEDPDGDVRKLAADVLGEIGSQAAVTGLVRALTDPNGNVQAAAAEALGKIGGKSGTAALEASLLRCDRSLRVSALDALVRCGAAPPLSVLAPLRADRYLRRQVFRLLGRLADPLALDYLLEGVGEPSRGMRETALAGLSLYASRVGDRAGGEVARWVRREPRAARAAVDHAHEALASDDPLTIKGALVLLGEAGAPCHATGIAAAASDERVREDARRALLRMGAAAGGPLLASLPGLSVAARTLGFQVLGSMRERAALPALLSGADAGTEEERVAAIEALRELGETSAIGPLALLLSDESVGEVAARALIGLGRVAPAAVREACVAQLAGRSAARALRILGGVGDADALMHLRYGFRSEDPDVRLSATEAAWTLGDAAAEGLLRLALTDDVPRVRASAAHGLSGFSSEDSVEALLAALHDVEPTVAAAAAESLGTCGDARVAEALEACVSRGVPWAGGPEALVVIAAVRALSRLGAARAEVLLAVARHPEPEVVKEAVAAARVLVSGGEVLLVAARHPRWDVRRSAAQALGIHGDRAHLPEVSRLAFDEKDSLVREAFDAAVLALSGRP
jgi:HEAT repeat protein